MSQLRCSKCKQLQYKYRVRGQKLEIEIKCYGCNTFSYLTIWLNQLTEKENEQNINNK